MRPALLTSLRGYGAADLLRDALAGASVAMVALPLSLAIAIASGAPPATGLVTAAVAGFLTSALGGSRVQIGGPTGAFIVVVAGVIAAHGFDGLVLATLMAGGVLVVAALLGAGALVRYVPQPVIHGFTIGIGVIIAASQLKEFFGLSLAHEPAALAPKLTALVDAAASLEPAALCVGLGTMAMIIALRRLAPAWPGLILAVALGSAAVAAFDLPVATIGSRFGALPSAPPMPSLPPLAWARIAELAPAALVIAFLAGVESLLSAMVADRLTGDVTRPNAEILAQGAANIASALVGGLPATGAIARTATNIRAGARTPVAGLVHAALVLLAMLVAAPLAERLALPALAGLLLLTAWNMAEPWTWAQHRRLRREDGALLLLTLLLTAFADLTIAIGIGVALGLAIRLRRRGAPEAEWEAPDR